MLEVGSNMPRSTTTVDEDLAVSPEAQAFLASLPQGERKMEQEEADDLAGSYEDTYLAYAKYRWRQQDRFMGQENEAMRSVNILSPNQIIRRLQRAGVDARLDAGEFWVEGIDHKTGEKIRERRERCEGRLWLHDFVNEGRIGISAWVMEKGVRVRQCITHLQYPWSQEWSLLYFDAYDVPIGERRRGWRTAMLELILKGVLTEDEVNRAFGPVALNGVSQLYRERLFQHRRKRMGR
jgi:hypothetical protein